MACYAFSLLRHARRIALRAPYRRSRKIVQAYKHDTSPRLLPVDLRKPLPAGTMEQLLYDLVDLQEI
jgi:hypothetical protein